MGKKHVLYKRIAEGSKIHERSHAPVIVDIDHIESVEFDGRFYGTPSFIVRMASGELYDTISIEETEDEPCTAINVVRDIGFRGLIEYYLDQPLQWPTDEEISCSPKCEDLAIDVKWLRRALTMCFGNERVTPRALDKLKIRLDAQLEARKSEIGWNWCECIGIDGMYNISDWFAEQSPIMLTFEPCTMDGYGNGCEVDDK